MEKATWAELLGEDLVIHKNDQLQHVTVEEALAGAQFIGLYFSAHWCPPCRGFTPVLVDTYCELQQADKGFQVVFVSSDRSPQAMQSYMQETNMPWPALPYGDARVSALKKRFQISSIPTLIVLNSRAELVTRDGRSVVAKSGPKALENCFMGGGDPTAGTLPIPFAISALCFVFALVCVLWPSVSFLLQ